MSEAAVTPPPFVHLRVHSEFSVVDGIVRIPSLIKRVAKLGQPAVALTDLSNIFGLIKFYRAARGAGIKPIAGCDVWISNDEDRDKPFRALLLVRNHAGYLNLCELLSQSFLTNQYKGRAELRREWLRDQQGLIVLSGGRGGDIGHALEAGNAAGALALARQWGEMFPGAFYIELQRAGMDGDEAYTQAAMRLAAQAGLPVVATHPVQFLDGDEFQAHEARVCIAEGEILADPRRVRRFSPQQYLLSSQEMHQRFADVPSALANSVEIAKRCNLSLVLGKPRLPIFPTPDGVTLDDYLVQLSEEGLEKRLEFLFADPAERDRQRPAYYERLRWECKTIIQMGFPGYFLIVQDFINWGKNNGVPVGPGRGSGAGSLVAYALGITDLDPIRYDLLFERFLNPERVSMPDFDIDFCQDNRERVIEYVKEKYGRAAVSQIATFGTLGAKAVVRDAGRVLDMPYMFCDGLSKLIPFNPADPWSLERTLKDEPAFKERYDQEEEVRALVDLAQPLEGLTRNIGMHAGGVLIAPGKLTDFCPLYCQPGQENSAVSQFDKDDVEAAGLVKFDFLGLRNLTILDWAVRYVRQFNAELRDFDIMALSLDDPAAYKVLCDANTTAVFQLESRGMKELLKKLRPNTFEDIIAMLALYRPGPLESGMVDDFVNRKHGRASVDYFHPDLEGTLKSTYGVIVYQEQVMLISQIIGGYSLGGADLLRRAMGKKKPEEMAKHRELFQKGAQEKGHDPDLAVKLFDLMEKFAGYGFNKSHSAAYALIAYQTAWLKAYHPAEFLAATLSSDMDDTDKVQIFCRDARDNGVDVLPPDVNESGYRFAPVEDSWTAKGKPPRTMRYGLGAVKGTGQGAVEEILRAREEGGRFANLFDFCRRVSKHAVNRRTIEALIRAGAFDTIEPNRAALLASVGTAMEAAEQAARSANQVSLFGDDSSEVVAGELAKVAPWNLHTKLTEEKAALGYFFSGHLFDSWRDEVRRIVPMPLARLEPQRDLQWMCGVLAGVRVMMTRRGKMVFAVLDDGTAQVEISVFNELYEKHRNRLKEDQLLIVQGKVSNDEYSGGMRIVAENLFDLQLAREARARALRVTLNGQADAARLRQLLNPFRAEPENGIPGVPVDIIYTKDNFRCTVRLGEEWRVRMADTLLQNLADWAKPEGVEVSY
ncbi:DNA polymerase III subunit alpha [Bordetella trematum]|uniref:DNA polymerase III subunit alpha n=1 Tax=Bordetella trematum TaxID=123899 RepID=A0A157PZZ0_9BORD|nr:DNA polymerase III subunit alpha [Bordetella trematum]AUL47643.1 DNA polymerase III subunit alpha [Bordetella trematum]AZR94512.1 DNA polymerase III subunit alpha [Bordetella trematum]NNH19225.1 DNA polymerase III subunit alpha [Bordetella trematum]QIM73065.1 DNA polymerase III subunit alpha [Bordetella trematum]CZZ87128.1 DNA polymerase III subunit alpha [Bordetella trematum]